MMYAFVQEDLVVGNTNAKTDFIIPDALLGEDLSSLRWNGSSIIKCSGRRIYFIDSIGIKHISQSDPSWSPLLCDFLDPLMSVNGSWLVKSTNDLLTDKKDNAYAMVKNQLYRFVTKTCDFPEWKQVNYLDRYYELNNKTNRNQSEQTELTKLESVRTWKSNLLTYRDQIKNNIYDAVDTANVDDILSGLSFVQPPFDL